MKDITTGKWRTKLIPSLKLAKEVEIKSKIRKIGRNLFNRKEKNQFDFMAYLKHAKLYKKSWKNGESTSSTLSEGLQLAHRPRVRQKEICAF